MQRTSLLIVMALFALLSGPTGADAKEFSLGPHSRSVLKAACDRAQGIPFGIDYPDAVYGCGVPRAQVQCAADGSECIATVPDTLPMTGTGLDLVLGTALAPNGRPVKIQPQDYRISTNP